MSRRQIPILPIFAMLAILAGAYGLYKNIEFEEVEFEVSQSAEARTNRLLAASFLLNTEGFDYEVKNNRRVFTDIDESDGVLWLTDATELEDQREAEKIIAWVESGGILLTSPAGQYGLDKSTISGWMFEQFGIEELEQNKTDSAEESNEVTSEDESESTNDNSEYDLKIITLPDSSLQNPQVVLFSDYEPYFRIADEGPENAQTIIDSPYLIHRSVGDGFIAVYSDEELFDSDRLDEADQGYLLLWLTQPALNKNVSIVFRPASSPGLFTVLWTKFTLAICLMGLALVAFLRWAASRLGPVEHELPPIKNNIMAHLEARGEFWYRHKHTNKIIGNVQSAAKENLQTSSGKLNASSADDTSDKSAVIKQACEKLQCSPEQAEHILYGHAKNDKSILSMSRALQRLNHHKQYKPK